MPNSTRTPSGGRSKCFQAMCSSVLCSTDSSMQLSHVRVQLSALPLSNATQPQYAFTLVRPDELEDRLVVRVHGNMGAAHASAVDVLREWS